jgi:hypothetical protein
MDTVEQLKRWSDELKGSVRWLVISNTVAGPTDIYDKSKLRKMIMEDYQGKEIILPKFPDFLMHALDKESLTIHAACKSDKVDFLSRSRCLGIISPAMAQIAKIQEVILP